MPGNKKTVSKYKPREMPVLSRTTKSHSKQFNYEDKPGKQVIDNAEKDRDWPRLILRGNHCNEFKSDLLTV